MNIRTLQSAGAKGGAKGGKGEAAPSDSMTRRRKKLRFLMLFTATAVLAGISFCGWVYHAKTQRDLNIKLFSAVRKNDTEVARRLLAAGADPNIRDVPQEPLTFWQQIKLIFHPKHQSEAEFHTLLERALYPNGETDPETAMNAVGSPEGENAPLVTAILEAGARTEDNSSESHETPLMTAVQFDQVQTVQTMLDHGANPMAKDDEGMIALHHLRDNLKIAEMLLKKGDDINAIDKQGRTPLMTAANKDNDGTIDMLRFLIAHGANVNARDKEGSSALLIAAYSNNDRLKQVLLEHGADASVCDSNKNTPLHGIRDSTSSESILMLLKHGAKVDAVNENGDTPLTAYFTRLPPTDYLAILHTLTAHGANVNHRNKAGQTALSLAKKEKANDAIIQLEADGAKR